MSSSRLLGTCTCHIYRDVKLGSSLNSKEATGGTGKREGSHYTEDHLRKASSPESDKTEKSLAGQTTAELGEEEQLERNK